MERSICGDCVSEAVLAEKIKSIGVSSSCDFCGEKRAVVSMAWVATEVHRVMRGFYFQTSNAPTSLEEVRTCNEYEEYRWTRAGQTFSEVLSEELGLPSSIVGSLQEALVDNFSTGDLESEPPYTNTARYSSKAADDTNYVTKWNEFELTIRQESRFFGRKSYEFLSDIFSNLAALKTENNTPITVGFGPDFETNRVFRARAFQSEDQIRKAMEAPDRLMGPPPSEYARSGRMNAAGISVFYGATDPNVAVSEVRPPVGSRVLVASFELLRNIRLLDLTAFNEIVADESKFSDGALLLASKITFMQSLSNRLAKPVMPNDEELEYLATQAIADFLSEKTDEPLDGILFPSVQAGGSGLNVVLFHKAAKVRNLSDGRKTRTQALTSQKYKDKGSVSEYIVYESDLDRLIGTSQASPNDNLYKPALEDEYYRSTSETEHRYETLMVQKDQLKVCEIKASWFDAEEFDVPWVPVLGQEHP